MRDAIDSENHELWLVKLPKNFRAERMEGQEIEFPSKKGLENASITPLDLKNNGVVQNALVTKETFSLPFVCPKKDKKLVKVRMEHGLKVEKAIQNCNETGIQDLEEEADTVSLQFKGKIRASYKNES